MHIVLGATGHVGSAVAETLLGDGENVTVVTRDEGKSKHWKDKGAQIAIADVHDVETLRTVLQGGKRLFLLNPPALPDTDTVAEERKSMLSIVSALAGSGIEKIVALSTYGAQAGDGIGDLGVLFEMEQELAKINIPTTVVRAAYYMSNWDGFLESAQKDGQIFTLYPADFKLPMVSPENIGQFAAQLLKEPIEKTGLYHIEGPAQYSPGEVAEAFSKVLGKEVETIVIPREEWVSALTNMGFSQKAGESMAAMTAVTLDEKYETTGERVKGETTINDYITQLVRTSG